MTTLAIIGGGIAGRSLLYNLTTQNLSFDKILFFESDSFASPCTLHSTAIVAPRGVTRGHSPLGDLIIEGYEAFADHVQTHRPLGVSVIGQYTGDISKLVHFKGRYPNGKMVSSVNGISLNEEIYFSEESAFMINPPLYLNWLMQECEAKLPLVKISEFVTSVMVQDKVMIGTQEGKMVEADHVVFATGSASRFWKKLLPASVAVQGSYLEFDNVNLGLSSFSITLEGYNLIYRQESQTLLMGSSTDDFQHVLAPVHELKTIYAFFQKHLLVALPEFTKAQVKVGHREKAPKRMPYIFNEGKISAVGGFYKNGFTLSLAMTRTLACQLPQLS